MNRLLSYAYGIVLVWMNLGCVREQQKLFIRIDPEVSGITFQNSLTETTDFNIFNYMYFYNGAGVSAGDLNGDGLPDIFFTSNQVGNRLYLNKGGFKFDDVTDRTNTGGPGGWATGTTMADVNGDGRLDIYVCYIGDYLSYNGKNQLFINMGVDSLGIPTFVEKASDFGLDLIGFSTQAVFFDYDRDGDLDMFMLNHSLHQNGTFGRAGSLRNQVHPTSGDKLMRNDGNTFVDVTKEAGIYSSVLGYGLGVAVADINLDGWPDIYVGNDFHENDYLYMNRGDGTFAERLDSCLRHTSRYTMGVDAGDINNDLFPDIVTMDMLPADYRKRKSSVAEDPYDVYIFKRKFGYNEQYTRNALQLNNQDGTFSEIGLFAGIGSTDWSWATLIADFDLDGLKDIFISNGIPRRSNDLDYINFVTVDSIQKRLSYPLSSKELDIIQRMPEVKVPNFLFRNIGDTTFVDMANEWGLEEPSYSTGAAYADLDNDGDLDLVINNTNDPAFVYENTSIRLSDSGDTCEHHYLSINLKGTGANTQGLGSKVIVYYDHGKRQIQESMTTRGYQSAVDPRLVFGLGEVERIDSILVIWNDGKFQKLREPPVDTALIFDQRNAAGFYDYTIFHSSGTPVLESFKVSLPFSHRENEFIEFNREGLMPFMVSAEGPASAIGDINGDGLDDIFLGGAKWQPSGIFIQTRDGQFKLWDQPLIESDSAYEDVDADFFDADKDGDLDLFVVSGGNEYSGKSEYCLPRLYVNNGKGVFDRRATMPRVYSTGACLAVGDLDGDSDMDVFLGSRAVPWKYGVPSDSYLLLNDGLGNFVNATARLAPQLVGLGLVKDAIWVDVDNDEDNDLIIAAEWMPIAIFINHSGKLEMVTDSGFESYKGLWNTILAADFDGDGDEDVVAGNLGLNSKLTADALRPLRLYVNDFDHNDSMEQVVSHIVDGREYPFHTRDELTKKIPSLKKKYLSYSEFSRAEFHELFPKDVIASSLLLEANETTSMYFENLGNGKFAGRKLPKAIQLSTTNALLADDINGDGKLDLLVGGNFYYSNIQMGRYDASYGTLLYGMGNGQFRVIPNVQSGLQIQGEVKRFHKLGSQGRTVYMAVRNNMAPEFYNLTQ